MTMPHVYVEPDKAPGQSMYETVASNYMGPDGAWVPWDKLSKRTRKEWAEMERDSVGYYQ